MSLGSVCSAGLWLMPFTLGVNTMPAGHSRASIWASWPAPAGGGLVTAEVERQAPSEDGDLGGDVGGVVTHRHRRGAGVVGLADHGELLPGDALHPGHGADVVALGLQDGSLLDVQLDVGVG